MSVWKRVRQYSKESVTSIIHGKAWHEETKATSSQARAYGSGHYLVVFNLAETDYVCHYIVHGGDKAEFLEKFKGAYSQGFDPELHLQAVGVANQTTMLRGETEEVQRRFKAAMDRKIMARRTDRGTFPVLRHDLRRDAGPAGRAPKTAARTDESAPRHRRLQFVQHVAPRRNGRGPSCRPTSSRTPPRWNPTKLIRHYDQHAKKEIETRDWLPSGNITVGITAGASCPNNLIEDVIRRLFELRGISVQKLLQN